MEKKNLKLYYPIGEVAEMFSVNTSLIRFWEKEFEIIKPKKNKKGNRLFTKGDIENFRLIFHLVKERGFTLQGAKNYIAKDPKKAADNSEIVARLEKLKGYLLDIKNSL